MMKSEPGLDLNSYPLEDQELDNELFQNPLMGTDDLLFGQNGGLLEPYRELQRGVSPSPPESQEPSPQSTNSSPRSSNSSPPQASAPKTQPNTFPMSENDFDFPMLDDANLANVNDIFTGNVPDINDNNVEGLNTGKGDGMDMDGAAQYFDFESAASSPLGVGKLDIMTQNVPRVFGTFTSQPKHSSNSALNTPGPMFAAGNSASPRASNHRKRRSEIVEYSPISPSSMAVLNFDTAQHSPASSYASGVSALRRNSKRTPTPPSSGEEDVLMMRDEGAMQPEVQSNPWSPASFTFTPSPMAQNISLGYPTTAPDQGTYSLNLRGDQPGNRIHEKSRVETQIRVNLNLSPLPQGVKKLHLPTHTISKPKLLSKPPLQRSADTLELYTSLVCASAVDHNPAAMSRALQRACDDPLQELTFGVKQRKGSTTDSPEAKGADSTDNKDLCINTEEDKPLNGGEVRICSGCIVRERKRAARKKVKRLEEEDNWAREEGRRIVVFNCPETVDWGTPESSKKPTDDNTAAGTLTDENHEDGAEVWLPIRIACYCRHQNEKTGFRIIFTIKDHMDNLVAQSITPPILITDDHKTNIPTSVANATSTQTAAAPTSLPTAPAYLIGASPLAAPQFPTYSPPSGGHFGYSASDTNLLSLAQPQNFGRNQNSPMQNMGQQSRPHSRQPSMSAQTQAPVSTTTAPPSAKKRKSNTGKVRNELAMTRLDNSPPASTSNQPPSFTPTTPFSAGPPAYDGTFPNTGPPTPLSESMFGYGARSQSMDNLQAMHSMFSAPSSTQPSRVPSPVQNQFMTQARQTPFSPSNYSQIQNALLNVANGQIGGPQQQMMQYEITRIVPSEGPCRGGIEVTLLGSGYHRGQEVMFGDAVSPKTEFWSDTTLVCILPPAACAGPVQVLLRYASQPQMLLPGRGKPFVYTDDTEHKMLALALQVINAKWSGKVEPPKDIAMRLLSDEKNSTSSSGTSTQYRSNHAVTHAQEFLNGNICPDLETQLLKVLDVIDMDDSLYPAKWNLRNKQGQTMLHLSCCLGMSRFSAALLARGANPDLVDRGGFRPMHFAALFNHPDLVRRLILNSANPLAPNLVGQIPADLAASPEVAFELSHGQRSRRNSTASVVSAPGRFTGRRSRSTSFASNHGWDVVPPQTMFEMDTDGYISSVETDGEDVAAFSEEDELWIRPKRSLSRQNLTKSSSRLNLMMTPRTSDMAVPSAAALSLENEAVLGNERALTPAAALAAIAAWRDQFANLGFNFNWNLPAIPNGPGYHLFPNPMARFNTMMAQAQNRDPSTPNLKEGEYRWWELFSNPSPPAYNELFPGDAQEYDTRPPDLDDKSQMLDAAMDKWSLTGASPRTSTEAKSRASFTTGTATASRSSSSSRSETVDTADSTDITRIGRGSLTVEQEEAIRVHQMKMQRIRGDRRLFFFWLPLMLIIVLTLATSWGTQTFLAIRTTYNVVLERMAEASQSAQAKKTMTERVVEVNAG